MVWSIPNTHNVSIAKFWLYWCSRSLLNSTLCLFTEPNFGTFLLVQIYIFLVFVNTCWYWFTSSSCEVICFLFLFFKVFYLLSFVYQNQLNIKKIITCFLTWHRVYRFKRQSRIVSSLRAVVRPHIEPKDISRIVNWRSWRKKTYNNVYICRRFSPILE